MELAIEGPEATNDDKNDEESIQDDESIHQKDCLDSPVRLSVWFATMTVPLICLLATWALVSVFSMASVSKLTSITTLIVEIADSQSNTVKDIQSSIAKQSSSANSFSDFLDDGKIDLLQQIQTSNEDQENLLSVLEGEIPRNRIEIEKSSGDVQTSLSRFRNSTRVGLSNKAELIRATQAQDVTLRRNRPELVNLRTAVQNIESAVEDLERRVAAQSQTIHNIGEGIRNKESKQVRLNYKRTKRGGLVEIYHNGVWGGICADAWDKIDGMVICKMLGYPGVTATYRNPSRARTKLWLTQVRCTGDEPSIWDCQYSSPESNPCTQDWQAYASCKPVAPNVGDVAP